MVVFIAGFVFGAALVSIMWWRISKNRRDKNPPVAVVPPATEVITEVENELKRKMKNDLERRSALDIIADIRRRNNIQ